MNTLTGKKTEPKGGEWLIRESEPADDFIPEDFQEEQVMVKEMCASFLDTEVLPLIDRIDKLEPGLMPSLLDKAGEQGLLGTSIPENLGGLGKDFVTATLVNEGLGGGYSFSVAMAAHTGIGTLTYFIFRNGSAERKIYSKTGFRRVERLLRTHGTEQRQ